MEAVGELDEDDPQVLRHRHHHLADVLRLLLLIGADRDATQLGDALDQAGHLGAELFFDLVGGKRGVLDGVVEQRRGEGLGVELQVGEDGRHLQRVVDVVLAGQPPLAAVGLGGTLVRLPDHLAVLGLEVVCDPEKLGNRHWHEFRRGRRDTRRRWDQFRATVPRLSRAKWTQNGALTPAGSRCRRRQRRSSWPAPRSM